MLAWRTQTLCYTHLQPAQALCDLGVVRDSLEAAAAARQAHDVKARLPRRQVQLRILLVKQLAVVVGAHQLQQHSERELRLRRVRAMHTPKTLLQTTQHAGS